MNSAHAALARQPASAVAWRQRTSQRGSHAHQRASLIGASEQVPVIGGRLALGTWQQLVLIDFDDRPRERTVVVQVVS